MLSRQIFQVEGYLSDDEVWSFVESALQSIGLRGKRVLVLVPDRTRTMPVPMVFDVLTESELDLAALDFMVALGTHPALDDHQLSILFGRDVINGEIGKIRIFNHVWDNPSDLREIGVISADEIYALTDGLMNESLMIRVNRRIFDYDHILICGPVFPHEVAGFSGGNKYFFPGISGPEAIHLTHWLGALLTSSAIIGSGYSPVRGLIDKAASFVNLEKSCFSFVLDKEGVKGVFLGSPESAWQQASDLSAKHHIHTTGRYYKTVLAVMPEMYRDLWVGGKGMYKLEPVVADGGELIIYAPHVNSISPTHGDVIMKIGYHVRDYFLAQWDQFKHYPWGVLAHATHVKGLGHFSAKTGEESPRINVTLATGIPEVTCRSINLGYLDPNKIEPSEWEDRENKGILVVRNAGEQLYRVK